MERNEIRKFHLSTGKKKPAYDEYYTTAEEVAAIFTEWLDVSQLAGKVVYSPADGAESEFTKWLESHKEEYKIKEFIHTSDDMLTHEDLFEKADVVITNPPFSIIHKGFMQLLVKHSCKFFIFGSMTNINMFITISKQPLKYIVRPGYVFNTPHINNTTNDYYTNVQFSMYITNMDLHKLHHRKPIKFKNNSIDDTKLFATEDNGTRIPAVDYVKDFPYDYAGEVLAPMSFVVSHNLAVDQFDIYNSEKPRKIVGWSDGKGRFKRLFVKRKPEFVGQKL